MLAKSLHIPKTFRSILIRQAMNCSSVILAEQSASITIYDAIWSKGLPELPQLPTPERLNHWIRLYVHRACILYESVAVA